MWCRCVYERISTNGKRKCACLKQTVCGVFVCGEALRSVFVSEAVRPRFLPDMEHCKQNCEFYGRPFQAVGMCLRSKATFSQLRFFPTNQTVSIVVFCKSSSDNQSLARQIACCSLYFPFFRSSLRLQVLNPPAGPLRRFDCEGLVRCWYCGALNGRNDLDACWLTAHDARRGAWLLGLANACDKLEGKVLRTASWPNDQVCEVAAMSTNHPPHPGL